MSFQEKYLCGESMDMYKASQHHTEKTHSQGLHFYDDLQIIEHEDEPLNRAERLKAVESLSLPGIIPELEVFPGEMIQNHTECGSLRSCSSRPG